MRLGLTKIRILHDVLGARFSWLTSAGCQKHFCLPSRGYSFVSILNVITTTSFPHSEALMGLVRILKIATVTAASEISSQRISLIKHISANLSN